ncbi:N-acetylneuraminate lyase [Facklamia sp. P12945]|uniref:N-acetylneuraminate lyase n=1 Tax=unclassified Facklamia TaxID=2622293 RepID=UPI003D16F301
MTKKTAREIKGIISALLVPFDSKGKVNEAGLRQVVRHNIDNMKVAGLYVGGSTGENFLLDMAIKKQIFEIVKDEVKDQVKLIAQVGGPNVYEAIELGKFATDLDYDAISAVTPFYYKFSFAEVKQYYKDITEAVDNDLIIYSIPVLTGINMGMAEFKELFELDNIVGVKFTAADFFLLERLRKAFPDVLIYSGFDEMLYPAAIYHVDGAIGSTYNVNGLRARGILEAVNEGNHEKALKLQNESNDLIEAVLANGLYPTLKSILQLQGANKGEFLSRKPMASMTADQKEEAERIFKNYL